MQVTLMGKVAYVQMVLRKWCGCRFSPSYKWYEGTAIHVSKNNLYFVLTRDMLNVVERRLRKLEL